VSTELLEAGIDALQKSAPNNLDFARTIVLPDGDFKGETLDPTVHPGQHCLFLAADEGASSICVVKPVQDGGSLIAFTLILRRVAALAQTAIIAYPTLTAGRDAWSKKVAPMLAAQGGMVPKTGGGSKGGAASAVIFPNGGSVLMRAAGGRHESGQASATADVLMPDEVDDWPDLRRVKLIEQRITKSSDPLVVFVSTVKRDGDGKDGSNILRIYEQGSQTRIEYPCPHCGAYQVLAWEAVDQEAGTINCAHGCGASFTESDRLGMLKHWRRRDGQKSERFSILWTALDSPFPIVINGKKRPVIQGLIDEWRYAEGQVALGDHSYARQFFRDRFCRQYRADLNEDDQGQTIIPTRNRIAALSAASEYALEVDRREKDGDSVHLAAIPKWVEHITVGADVQSGGDRAPGRIYFLAIGRGKGRSYLAGWGTIFAAPIGRQPTEAELHTALDRLDALMRDWNPAAPIVSRGVDVGDRQHELVRWTRRHPKWHPVKGTGPLKAVERNDLPGWIYVRDQEGGWRLRLVETQAATRQIHGELMGGRGIGAMELPKGIERTGSLAQHFCATVEYAPDKWSQRASDRKYHPEWQFRHDLLDCAAYARALAYEWENKPVIRQFKKYGELKAL
jgi:hypothetical protein